MGVAVLVALGGVYWYVKGIGFKECENEVLVKTVEVIKERQRIANLRPDDNANIKRLRSGSF